MTKNDLLMILKIRWDFLFVCLFVLSFQIEITNNDEIFEMRCVILAINHIWMAHINFGNDFE